MELFYVTKVIVKTTYTNNMEQQTSVCTHEARRREYYRPGCYKCWECGSVIVESSNSTDIPKHTDKTADMMEELKQSVNKLSYVVNHVGINDSFDRTLARDCIDDVVITFNAYIQTLIK